jgi:hypothetical protein
LDGDNAAENTDDRIGGLQGQKERSRMAGSPRLTRHRLRAGGPGVLLAGALAAAALTVTAGGAVAGAATVSGPVGTRSAQVTSAKHAFSRNLCRRPAAADRVVIARYSPSARPRSVTVTSMRQVRSAARAVCALPRLPAGANCPAIAAGFHRLTFTAGRRKFSAVTVQDVGCKLATGLKTMRQADKPRFWKLIRKLMRENPAGSGHEAARGAVAPLIRWKPHALGCGLFASPMLHVVSPLSCLDPIGPAGLRF